MSVQLVALLANIGLALLKFTIGLLAGSRALIADAFNSAGDVVATGVAWIAFRIGRAPADDDHAYGHANAEALAGLLIGGILCATGAFIILEAAVAWVSGRGERAPPEWMAAWAALFTMTVKEGLYRVSMRVGRATHSPTLLASARDHRADVVTSATAGIGVVLAQLGWSGFDDVAGAAIGGYLFALGIPPVRENLRILMAGAPPELAQRVAAAASAVAEVRDVREAKAMPMGGRYHVDMTITVAGDRTVRHGHEVAHRAEDAVRAAMPEVTEVRVHVEPAD